MRRILLSLTAVVTVLALSGINAKAKSEKASVMSFNIRIQLPTDTGEQNWESRKEGCVKAIRKYFPDILGIQEATAGQKSFIMKELPKYIMIDGSTKPGTVNEATESEFNPILFRADRFELLDYGLFWLNEDQTPEKKGWDAEYVRTANWVKLRFRKSGQIMFIFNTHFDNIGEESRHKSSELIVEKVKEIAGSDAIVFLTGSFNAKSGDKSLKPLSSFLQEAEKTVRKADKVQSFNDFGRKGGKPAGIDHIFCRNAEARNFDVVDEPKFGVKYISDHYPVVSEIIIELPKD